MYEQKTSNVFDIVDFGYIRNVKKQELKMKMLREITTIPWVRNSERIEKNATTTERGYEGDEVTFEYFLEKLGVGRESMQNNEDIIITIPKELRHIPVKKIIKVKWREYFQEPYIRCKLSFGEFFF